jgi:hypothetical protein
LNNDCPPALTPPTDAIVKHWALNLVVNCPMPLCLVYPIVKTEALNVKEIPGFEAEDYAAVLKDLLSQRLIQLSTLDGATAPDWSAILELLRLLPVAPTWVTSKLPGGQIYFELTTRGGATWQRLAEPNWSHILIESSDLESCELFSPDRHKLMAFMGWYQELHGRAIDLETVEITRKANFPILYWKRLPFVYHASFQLKPSTTGQLAAKRIWSFRWLREWAALPWHRAPWDLPGWAR